MVDLLVQIEMGKLELGGCIFCSEKGSGEHLNNSKTISKQVCSFFKSHKAKRANKFIAYFQNFTNTYDTIDNLKEKYDSSLIDDRIVALAIATRPDCIDEDVVNLLKSYSNKYYVWVELGLQTSNNETGNIINRGYDLSEFEKALILLNKYNIDVVTHIMVGLPGETTEDLKNTINFVNTHNIQGLKIHSTYVVENTILAKMYEKGLYEPISFDYYLDSLTYILTHLRKDIVVHRISGDAPKDILIAPEWNKHKKWIINGLFKRMNQENLYQGMYYDR